MFNTYDLADYIRLSIDITISGSYVDPNHLALYVTRPDGITDHFIYGQTGTFGRLSTGKYYLDYFVNDFGQYTYKFFASGTAWGAELQRLVVRRE